MVEIRIIPPDDEPPAESKAYAGPHLARRQSRHRSSADKDVMSKDFLLRPPSGTSSGHRRKLSAGRGMPDRMRLMVEEAIGGRGTNVISEKPVTLNKKGKTARPPKTKEELDKEMKEILWKINIFGRIQDRWADLEFKAFHSRVAFADFCVHASIILIPLLTLALIWDLVAARYLHIPHLTTLKHPGLTVPFHFMAMPMGMYGFMLLILHQDRTKLVKLALVCIIVHPILLILRITLEIVLNGSRPEGFVRYEKYVRAADEIATKLESKTDVLDNEFTLQIGWPII